MVDKKYIRPVPRAMATAKNDSLGRRYLIKLASNLLTAPLFLVMEALLPRALGPTAYGNFNYITALFLNFTNFLDMGSSTCLNTALSKRPSERALLAFYARVAALVLLLCLLTALLLFLPGLNDALLPGVPLWMLLPAAFWAWLSWAGRVARGVNDALGFTWRSEQVRMVNNLLSMLALIIIYAAGLLTLPALFGHQFLFLSMLALGFLAALRKDLSSLPLQPAAPAASGGGLGPGLAPGAGRLYAREFWRYSSPLFVTALCSALALSGERWLLQYFEGSAEQGFFSLSQRIGVACFLFVTAMTPLLMRELAVAHGRGDPARMAALLDRYAPMLYAISACMSCFVMVEAPSVALLFGGSAFAGAVTPVRVMALYPVHQGYGQVAAAVFYASGKTRELRNISLAGLLAGLAAAWLFVAPSPYGGLGLGASGLALKMVLVQFVTVNLLLLACRGAAPFNYARNLVHQATALALFAAAALAARFGSQIITAQAEESLVRLALSALLYGLFCLGLTFFFPFVAGLKRGEAAALAARFKAALAVRLGRDPAGRP